MVTFNTSISQGTDDATNSENPGAAYEGDQVTITLAGLIPIGGQRTVSGFRFQNVTVPQGATITNAFITFDSLVGRRGGQINVWGVDVDNSSTWAETTNEPKDATLTTATHNVTVDEIIGFADVTCTDCVQEIVDRGGWSSGNNMSFIFEASSNNQWGVFAFEAIEVEAGVPAELTIEYVEVSGRRIFITQSM